MPRCPNGTRRNKSTGNCEPNNVKSKKNEKTAPKKKTQKKCPKGTQRYYPRGKCLPITNDDNKSRNKPQVEAEKKRTLTDSEIEEIIEYANQNENHDFIKEKLQKLKFDPKYKSVWTGKPHKDLYTQARDKVLAWGKYKDEIE
jgi:hypothetical protein